MLRPARYAWILSGALACGHATAGQVHEEPFGYAALSERAWLACFAAEIDGVVTAPVCGTAEVQLLEGCMVVVIDAPLAHLGVRWPDSGAAALLGDVDQYEGGPMLLRFGPEVAEPSTLTLRSAARDDASVRCDIVFHATLAARGHVSRDSIMGRWHDRRVEGTFVFHLERP